MDIKNSNTMFDLVDAIKTFFNMLTAFGYILLIIIIFASIKCLFF